MKVYDAANIRNVALVGHSGSGKTQLTSAALFDAGAVNRFGKVDDGTTVTDFDEEEISRKHTLSSSLAYAEWNKTKINFIDTPGIANFLADARAALRVADAAIVVVDAVSGVQVQTEKTWQAAEEAGLPRLVVVNRLDRERASLERTLKSIHETLSRTVIPVQLPIGEEKSFRGVVDLVAMKAYVFPPDGSGKFTEGAVPPDMADRVVEAREAHEPLPACVALLSPWVDLTGSGDSIRERAARDPWIDPALMYLPAGAYAGEVALDSRLPGLVAGYRDGEIPYFVLLSERRTAAHRAALESLRIRILREYRALDAFEAGLNHERFVTESIGNLMELARAEKNHAAEIMLNWFVTEQVEEEANFSLLIRKLKRVEGDGRGLLLLDQELGQRVFVPPAATVA